MPPLLADSTHQALQTILRKILDTTDSVFPKLRSREMHKGKFQDRSVSNPVSPVQSHSRFTAHLGRP